MFRVWQARRSSIFSGLFLHHPSTLAVGYMSFPKCLIRHSCLCFVRIASTVAVLPMAGSMVPIRFHEDQHLSFVTYQDQVAYIF